MQKDERYKLWLNNVKAQINPPKRKGKVIFLGIRNLTKV